MLLDPLNPLNPAPDADALPTKSPNTSRHFLLSLVTSRRFLLSLLKLTWMRIAPNLLDGLPRRVAHGKLQSLGTLRVDYSKSLTLIGLDHLQP